MSDPRDVWIRSHECDELREARPGLRPVHVFRYGDDPRTSLGWFLRMEGNRFSLRITFCPYCGKKLEKAKSKARA